MLPTKIYTFTIAANATYRLLVAGQYFKLLAAAGAVRIDGDFGRLDDLIAGQGLEATPFSFLNLTDTSGAINTVRLLVGDENFIDGVQGNVNIGTNKQPSSGIYANVQNTVTSASAQLLAANATRQYLFIQNQDSSGTIFIKFGSAGSLLDGIRILPGEAFEMSGSQSTQAIFAIGSIASNTKVVTVQG